jgi:hypothetical protein
MAICDSLSLTQRVLALRLRPNRRLPTGIDPR